MLGNYLQMEKVTVDSCIQRLKSLTFNHDELERVREEKLLLPTIHLSALIVCEYPIFSQEKLKELDQHELMTFFYCLKYSRKQCEKPAYYARKMKKRILRRKDDSDDSQEEDNDDEYKREAKSLPKSLRKELTAYKAMMSFWN
jgi:hypothetical protein